ncbi:TetR/AcrR family transcriptional regulator [Xanthobacter autotrophicus]|uniref:TetR/AcrR family transcriptional regulator n=1 Tax=Xanthobacter autotrophicus TaxID=280 RepID=UPI00372933FD
MQTQSATPQAVRGRGRPKVHQDAELATRIVQAAYAILGAQGYAGMNMGEVAVRCGISKKTVYQLFPSKLALFRAITDVHRDAMIDLRQDLDDIPVADALMKIFRMDIDEKSDAARRSFMRVVMIESLQVPELKQIVDEHGRDRTFFHLAEWLDRQRTRGRIVVADVQGLTKMIIDIAFGAILHPAPEAWQMNDRALYLRQCFGVLAAGITPPGASHAAAATRSRKRPPLPPAS